MPIRTIQTGVTFHWKNVHAYASDMNDVLTRQYQHYTDIDVGLTGCTA